MAQKFLTNIELEAGLVDGGNSTGTSGYLLSSTGTATSWVDPAAVSVGESEQVHIACKNTSGVAISKGDPVYITGTVGTSFRIEIAKADASDSAKMPAVGLAETDLGLNAEGFVIVSGVLKNLTTDPLSTSDGTPSSNDTVYVKAGGGLTKTKPTGSGNLIQNVGKVGRVSSANSGSLAVSTIMRTNDVPNLTTGKIWVGSPTYTTESTVVHLDETNGRMGIGTTSPNRSLHVIGQVAIDNSTSPSGGLLVSPDGTSNKVYSRTGNATTSAHPLDFISGSSTSMRIDTSGNVGIGTTSPGYRLDVDGSTSNAALRVSSTDRYTGINFTDSLNSTNLFYDGQSDLIYTASDFKSADARFTGNAIVDGNVGIGTTSPASALHINQTYPQVRLQSTGDNTYTNIGSGSNYMVWDIINPLTNTYQWRSGGSAQMTINTSGNVGIGTTTPSDKLHVVGASRLQKNGETLNLVGTDHVYSAWYPRGTSNGRKAYMGYGGANTTDFTAMNQDTGAFIIGTNNAERMRIISNGNVGIGTTSPGYKLEVNGTFSSNAIWTTASSVTEWGSGTTAYGTLTWDIGYAKIFANSGNQLQFAAGGASTDMTIDTSGNVGIGTTSPAHKLDVVGNVKISSGGLAIENTSSHGYVALPGGAFYHSTSGTETGAIKITLPTHGTGDMLSFVVDIFDYATNESFTVNIKGYLYQTTGNNEWVNVSAQTIASNINRNFTVRFGADGSNNCVWIGETNSVWSYPQIQVRDFTAGFSADMDSYIDGWDVDIVTSFDTVDLTYFSPFPMSKEVYGSGIHLRGSGSSYFNGGNVGIGTTNPSDKLQVEGTIRADSPGTSDWAFLGYNNLNTAASGIWFDNGDGELLLRDDSDNLNIRLRSDSSSYINGGNVGIGTTSPQEKLHVQNYTTGESHQAMFKGGAVTVGDYSYVSLNNGYSAEYNKEVRLAAVSEQSNSNKTGFAVLTSPDANGASGHERLRVTADGDVGIGTTSPGAKLEVEQSNSGTGTVFLSNSYNNKGFRTGNAGYATFSGYQDGNNTGSGNAYGALIGLNTFYNGTSFYNDNQYVDPSSILFKDGDIKFHTNDVSSSGNFTPNERLRITKAGNVGIGVTSPTSRLHVQQTLASPSVPMVYFEADRGPSAYGATNVRVDNLDYGTGMKFYRSGTYDGGAVGFINGSSTVGSISIGTSSTSYNTTSDYRLKENVASITDGITRLKQLQPKRFNFIGDTSVVDGFIAHEAKQVVPEAVTGEKDEVLPNGDPVYQGIDQAKLVPLLTAALQEAITKIEDLENRIQTLENN